ncbi:rpl3 (nucleomorph) [Hemiselmis andersenii]|uniref:Rpl3 n=1 Tax=Hemiselmis andersenii TaxID=464988 RepID=A9BKF3_HEMAN|nr:rpl3 [Hemiselmis andersenii]ABW97986.1 rpl3 [Hemiselmis andersenii]|mmetsp:Transcript_39407/g.92170  ORF Transcript_39407/g.92170 Transcript_39407/m.92170 type:complete len:389 (-) Transcript_39407:1307-2473(-)
MSHRKYEAPRHGSLGFLPKKRCRRGKGKIKSFPKDNENHPCHLTASIGFKAGMTHVVRTVDKFGSKLHGKDVVEAVTVIETPPLQIVGFVGYIKTPKGLRSFRTVWSTNNFPEEFKRNFYKNWYKSKRKAFKKKQKTELEYNGFSVFENQKIKFQIKKFCPIIRCIAFSKISKTGLKQKKAPVLEIQINGGNTTQKINFVEKISQKEISISDIFRQREIIDTIGITKGKGFQGVIKRWGVTKLPRKTHRGARKVACVGSWHPSRVSFRVPRAGQTGFHHRTQINLQIYRVGKALDSNNGSTEFDLSTKKITPMGGFPYYGNVKEDFLLLKGCVMGSKKRQITLRKSLSQKPQNFFNKKIQLKFIDTSSKWGHGRFQTKDEKINAKNAE